MYAASFLLDTANKNMEKSLQISFFCINIGLIEKPLYIEANIYQYFLKEEEAMNTEESSSFNLTVKRLECNLLNTWETCALLRMSIHTLAKMRCTNPERIPYTKIRNRVYYYRDDVEKFLTETSRRYGQ